MSKRTRDGDGTNIEQMEGFVVHEDRNEQISAVREKVIGMATAECEEVLGLLSRGQGDVDHFFQNSGMAKQKYLLGALAQVVGHGSGLDADSMSRLSGRELLHMMQNARQCILDEDYRGALTSALTPFFDTELNAQYLILPEDFPESADPTGNLIFRYVDAMFTLVSV